MTRLEVEVSIDKGPTDAAQLAAWRRFWKLLMAKVPQDKNAPSGELEASELRTARQPCAEELHERPHRTTP
jgi:hypothetical protein